jgi:glycosyltransferase involved in cell wall biosynthesis
MVGTIEPRKGHDKALAALEVLWNKPLLNENFKLLVVGRPGWKTGSLQKLLRQHPENKRRLRWIDDASDEYLDKLYQASWGVLMPSRGEGFGLPIIEAATYAKPILARDLPVFREISPPNVEFFSSDKAEDLAIAIRSWRRKSRRTDAISKEVEASAVAAELLDLIHQHLILEDGSLNHKR